MFFFFLGCVAIFAANPSWTLVILKTSPQSIRSLAVGIATIMYHILGDVPAPILIGKVIDFFTQRAAGDEEKLFLVYHSILQYLMFMSVLLVGFRGGNDIGIFLGNRLYVGLLPGKKSE